MQLFNDLVGYKTTLVGLLLTLIFATLKQQQSVCKGHLFLPLVSEQNELFDRVKDRYNNTVPFL